MKAGNNNGAAFGGPQRALRRPEALLFPAFSGYGGMRRFFGGAWGFHVPRYRQLGFE